MFKDLKIGTRLIYGYAIIILITAIISILGMVNFEKMVRKAESTNQLITYPIGQLVNFSIPYGNLRSAMRDIAATLDAEETEKQKNSMETNWALMETAFLEYKNLVEENKAIVSPDEYEAVRRIDEALISYKAILFDHLIPAAVANDNEEAIRIRKADLVPPGNIIRDNINFLVGLNVTQSSDALTEMKTIRASTVRDSIMLLILVIILVAILAYFIIRSITRPIRQMIVASDLLAKGEINLNLSYQSKDEVGVLSNNFRKVVESIRLLLTEIQNMSTAMDRGDTDNRINTSCFEGSYKHVALGVNGMMIHILEETQKFLDCLIQFSNGDFSADIEPLPGKKAIMNESLNHMRSNLRGINKEINELVSQATKGQLSFRADADSYGGDCAKILNALNRFMEVVGAPINEAKEVLSEVSLGNFDQKMTGQYDGDFQIIKNSINSTVENIVSYVDEITLVLTRLSQKDLNQSIEREYVGKFSMIKDAINHISNILNDIIQDLLSASLQVTSGARQISEGSMALAQDAEMQAASTQEISATISTINEGTSRNAKSAKEAEALSESARNNAANGNRDMDEMLVSMDSIKDSSNSISKIIKVIEDIAFQTNLLALNAAVEAARAGVHGKGFAVVAEEVRNLASRSQNAAKETAELIEESITRVNEGAKIANQTAATLHAIVNDITKISGIITSIAFLSEEQARSIHEITNGISQMAEIVEKVSATSQESASATEELSSQAQLLQSLVDPFHLKK